MMSHLSSEQLERALAGQASPEIAAHLRRCAQCTEELAASRDLFFALQHSASAIAEKYQHAAQIPSQQRPPQRTPRMAWGLATAALFLGVLSPLLIRHHYGTPAMATPPNAAQSAPVLSDDALLDSVQNDLTASVPDSLLPLAGSTTISTSPTSSTQRKN